MDDLNFWGVNWIDGMLVTSKHLNQQEDFINNLNRWSVASLSGGYGVVRSAVDRNEPLDINLFQEGDNLMLSVSRCLAIMPNGSAVNITNELTDQQPIEIEISTNKQNSDRLAIYLYCSSAKRIQFGEPLEGEQLSRAPYQINELSLSVGIDESKSSMAGIQIAELIKGKDGYQLSSRFVPPIVTTTCGEAVSRRMERIKQLTDRISKAAHASIAEVREKTRSTPAAALEETNRGIFLQAESILHHLSYKIDHIFNRSRGVIAQEIISFCRGMSRGFSQGFLIYPELRESVRTASLALESGEILGGSILPELQEYADREYGFHEMTRFFDDTERILLYINEIFNYYAKFQRGVSEDILTLGEHRFQKQHHGAVKYSFRSNKHQLIIDGVDPRGTEDVVVRINKKVLSAQFASTVIIYLGANDVDDIGGMSVARKPVEDVKSPEFWLIQPNEYFPLKCDRLDRLNIILDGDLDRAAVEAIKMEDISIFSRSR